MESHAIEITNQQQKAMKFAKIHIWKTHSRIHEKVWTTLVPFATARREEWNKLFSIEKQRAYISCNLKFQSRIFFIFIHCKQMQLLLFNAIECKNELSKWHALLNSLHCTRRPISSPGPISPILRYLLCCAVCFEFITTVAFYLKLQ